MAKPSPSAGQPSRSELAAAKLREVQAAQRAQRQRSLVIIGTAVAVALGIIGLSAWPSIRSALYDDGGARDGLPSIGGSPAQAQCGEVVTKAAEGNNEHRPPGTRIDYEDSPPAFGPHWDAPAISDRKFFTEDDRPPVGQLVHNLEHGYTILWYDETVADSEAALGEVRDIVDSFPGPSIGEGKFIAAPWTEEDGEAFPDDANIALTHWAARDGVKGVWLYCGGVSGEAVKQFTEDYPYSDSPEPTAP